MTAFLGGIHREGAKELELQGCAAAPWNILAGSTHTLPSPAGATAVTSRDCPGKGWAGLAQSRTPAQPSSAELDQLPWSTPHCPGALPCWDTQLSCGAERKQQLCPGAVRGHRALLGPHGALQTHPIRIHPSLPRPHPAGSARGMRSTHSPPGPAEIWGCRGCQAVPDGDYSGIPPSWGNPATTFPASREFLSPPALVLSVVHLNPLAGCRAASADAGVNVWFIWPCSGLQYFLPASTEMLKCQKWFIPARKSLLHPCLPSQPQDSPRGELGFPTAESNPFPRQGSARGSCLAPGLCDIGDITQVPAPGLWLQDLLSQMPCKSPNLAFHCLQLGPK